MPLFQILSFKIKAWLYVIFKKEINSLKAQNEWMAKQSYQRLVEQLEQSSRRQQAEGSDNYWKTRESVQQCSWRFWKRKWLWRPINRHTIEGLHLWAGLHVELSPTRPAPSLGVQFKPWLLCSQIGSLLMAWEDSSWRWHKYLDACGLCGRRGWSSQLLSSRWPSADCRGHLGSECM